jgi:hypothetical protein
VPVNAQELVSDSDHAAGPRWPVHKLLDKQPSSSAPAPRRLQSDTCTRRSRHLSFCKSGPCAGWPARLAPALALVLQQKATTSPFSPTRVVEHDPHADERKNSPVAVWAGTNG